MVCHPLGNSPLRLQFTTFLEIPQISYPPLFLCRFQYQVQRYGKSSAKTSFGDLKSKLFLDLLFSNLLIFRTCFSSMSLKEVPSGMYC